MPLKFENIASRANKQTIETTLTTHGSGNKAGGFDVLLIVNSDGSVVAADAAAYDKKDGRTVKAEIRQLTQNPTMIGVLDGLYKVNLALQAGTLLTESGSFRGLVLSFENWVIGARLYGDKSFKFAILTITTDPHRFLYGSLRDAFQALVDDLSKIGA